uniref:Putative conserved secreted protein n=1 Tax=Ixodes scapularis TaxID=6945 RepID=A0A4D5RGC6_IXOSC
MLLLLRPCSLSRFVGVCTASRKLCSAEPTRAVLEKHRTPTHGQWPRVLSVRLPCSLRIGPVDAMDADAVSVSLVGSPESPLRPTLKLGREDDSLTLSMSGAESKDLDGLLCCVRLPAMLSVEVHLSGKAQAALENLVLDQCTVTTEDGDIALSSIKTNKAELCTLDGWIRSKGLLQGHLSLTSKGSGVSTSSGDQTVAAAYVERATMVSTGGNLRLGTLHSCSAALKTSSGSVSLGGLDGDCSVSTDSGDIHVVVARTQNLDVDTNTGDVGMLLSSPHQVSVDADSVSSSLDASMTTAEPSGDVGRIAIRSRVGTVSLRKQDWVSSLNLGARGSS